MKFGLVAAALFGLSLSVSATATTLKLSPDIDLLVVDGKKITGSLLKGADSLELDGGQHQLLFTVNKSLRKTARTQVLYTSLPLIVAFNSQNVDAVSIQLPRIENERESRHFDDALNYKVVDKNGKALPVKRDVLPMHTLAADTNLEKVIADYNSHAHPASIPALAHLRATIIEAPLNTTKAKTNQRVITMKGENVSEQMLQHWFLLADKETQKQFIRWANQRANH
ncbi:MULTISPECIES: DUF2057 family protein [unclassified Serratia (in: enterobacteria)]|uniref:DUF2057 family protein n=1 Tax=unclassified Serratia (in: enterobacteria) TaxID=2647522 RepID=UPI0004FF6D18|nr:MULTISPECIES: DUF2057 family protein [unclassified Serratia (in: enterobacteria)]KFK93183.1 hypothetical protein JV45_17140 [Serratia sp. Ag2]KFK99622.1 hypothetical protein IV04_05540 [Serratia sp. Ag1]